MAESPDILIHGRCACGKRYRIRNAQAGAIVKCPQCGRAIRVTDADLQLAAAGQNAIPLQAEQAEVREAILLEPPTLQVATAGSREGLTGRTELTHPDALISAAMQGGLRVKPTSDVLAPREPAVEDVGADVRRRRFTDDLLDSFSIAGRRRNAGILTSLTLVLSLLLIVAGFPNMGTFILMGWGWRAGIVVWVVIALVVAVVMRFLWRTMTFAAAGEDDLPMIDTDWDAWEDALKPVVWIGIITALCAAPAGAAYWYPPLTGPAQNVLIGALLVLGSLLWPIAILSVAVGEQLRFMRPDWLIRCIVGVGPVYLIAWLQVLFTVGALIAFFVCAPSPAAWSVLLGWAYLVLAVFITLYLGFVLFRTLGLLYRHFHNRFPWKL